MLTPRMHVVFAFKVRWWKMVFYDQIITMLPHSLLSDTAEYARVWSWPRADPDLGWAGPVLLMLPAVFFLYIYLGVDSKNDPGVPFYIAYAVHEYSMS